MNRPLLAPPRLVLGPSPPMDPHQCVPQDIMPEGVPSDGSVPPEFRPSVPDHFHQGEDALNATNGDSAPPKKARVDCSDYDEATSVYSVPEDMDANEDAEGGSFTTVTYHKSRPSGIPILFKPVAPEASFWKVNPNVVAREVVAVAKEQVLSHRINRDGSLSLSVPSLAAAQRLLETSKIASLDVKAEIPRSYCLNFGRITDVPIEYTEHCLLEYLKEVGVVSVCRQKSFVPGEDGSVEERPLRSVVLQFRPDRPMPTRVFLGFTSHPVTEYFGTAIQCYKCQRHGHIAKFCRGPLRCKVCSGPHSHKVCPSRREPRCANCGGSHAATFAGCPRKKAATAAKRHIILHGKSPTPRRNKPNASNAKGNASFQQQLSISRGTYAEVTADSSQRTPRPAPRSKNLVPNSTTVTSGLAAIENPSHQRPLDTHTRRSQGVSARPERPTVPQSDEEISDKALIRILILALRSNHPSPSTS
ncbi:hypothetical protein HPB48_016459 [Haemaphysalis longicornis]|uniref:CCHC-type domain-containing protein n=1 Tax=Haemaphysalis longicornis TaxID=44386 RepID=A0A9J6FPL0_HAELO|nr:hypothetical protein HPB48_016459 [Haemaphysalis longicornis]